MNILFTSSGRRGYLINFFKQALDGQGLVYAGNSQPYAPSFYYADKCVITPNIYDDNYIAFLLDYCIKEKIELIIPLFDVDLLVLSKHKETFYENGIRVLVSEEKVIDVCNDKWKTYLFCKENKINVPKTFISLEDALKEIKEGNLSFPLVVKPRWGMGSISVYQVENIEELRVIYAKIQNDIFKTYLKYESAMDMNRCVLIQEKMVGQEFGLDIMNDLSRNYCLTCVKKKIAMRSGETDCAIVIKDQDLESLGAKLSIALKHEGNLDVDIFLVNGTPYLLEMNARFGGGYPFTHLSGINLPAAIIKWIHGKPLTDELKIKRYGVRGQKDINIIEMSDF